MLKKILIGLAGLIAVLLVVAALQPSTFEISRSVTIAAPAAVIFPHVNDLHKMNEWSPWVKIDPNAKQTYGGPADGAGASYSWDGNKDVGAGRMTITESRLNERVDLRLDFLRPFANTATTDFTLKSESGQTVVTQTMHGHNNFVGRVMCLVMNMNKRIGGQFEKGLASLKMIVEGTPKT